MGIQIVGSSVSVIVDENLSIESQVHLQCIYSLCTPAASAEKRARVVPRPSETLRNSCAGVLLYSALNGSDKLPALFLFVNRNRHLNG